MASIKRTLDEYHRWSRTTTENNIKSAMDKFKAMKVGEYLSIWFRGHKFQLIFIDEKKILLKRSSNETNEITCQNSDEYFEHICLLIERAAIKKG